jgi:hypothetical protein
LFLWNIADIRKDMATFRTKNPLVPGEEKKKKVKKTKKQRKDEKEQENELPETFTPTFGGIGGTQSFLSGVDVAGLLAGPVLGSSDGTIITRTHDEMDVGTLTTVAVVPGSGSKPPRPTQGMKRPRSMVSKVPLLDHMYIEYRQSISNTFLLLLYIYICTIPLHDLFLYIFFSYE